MSIHVMILCDLQSHAHLQACIERDPYMHCCAKQRVSVPASWFKPGHGDFPLRVVLLLGGAGTSPSFCPRHVLSSQVGRMTHACGMHVDKELQGSIFHHALTVFVCCQVLYCLSTQMFKVWWVRVFGAFWLKLAACACANGRTYWTYWVGKRPMWLVFWLSASLTMTRPTTCDLLWWFLQGPLPIFCVAQGHEHINIIFLNMFWHVGRWYMHTSCTHTHIYAVHTS